MNRIEVTESNVRAMALELETLLDEVPEKRRDFAKSLIKQSKNPEYTLSEKQRYWVGRLIEIAVVGDIIQSTVSTGGLEGLIGLFMTAKEHLKYPKITLELPEHTFQLSMAGGKSRFPGWVNITDGKPYGENTWYGRVSPQGEWVIPDGTDQKIQVTLLALLHAFSIDAAAAAASYGSMTGNCCFCKKTLTVDKSTDVGYGPVCAKNFNLPWGAKS